MNIVPLYSKLKWPKCGTELLRQDTSAFDQDLPKLDAYLC